MWKRKLSRKVAQLLGAVLLFSTVTQGVAVTPAWAHSGAVQLTFWEPTYPSTSNKMQGKAQLKVTSCDAPDCRMPTIGIQVRVYAYLITNPSITSTGPTRIKENTLSKQVTYSASLLCRTGRWRYYTQANGYFFDHGNYFETGWQQSLNGTPQTC